MEHFDMLIQPEKGTGVYPVSLWAMRRGGVEQRLYAAPQGSWLEYSQRLEQAQLMEASALGRADACVFRGEPMVQPVECSLNDLARLGFGEAQVKLPKQLVRSSLAGGRRADSVFLPKAGQQGSLPGLWARVVSAERALAAAPAASRTDRRPEIESPDVTDPTFDAAYGTANGAEPQTRNQAPGFPQALKMKRPLRDSIALLGVSIDNLSMLEVVEMVDRLIDEGGCHQVATANVDFLTKAFDDGELLDILHGCEMVLADGMPLVWASKLLGVPLKERVAGADLVPRLLDLSARKGRRVFLLGATEGNSRAAAERIRFEYPEAVICGRYSPPFTSEDWREDELILQMVGEAKPDLLLVAFGNPKQEKWIAKYRNRLNVPVCIGVGASIDFLSGRQSRAPLWMRQLGLEWMYRLAHEPRRLAVRYLNNGVFLLRYLSVQLLATSLQPRGSRKLQIKSTWHGPILTIGISGGFRGAAAKELFDELEKREYDDSLILDLTSTESIAPDAAGLLVHLAQRCTRTGKELWITGAKPSLRSVLRATFPAGEPFRVATTLQDALHFVRSRSLHEARLEGLKSDAAQV